MRPTDADPASAAAEYGAEFRYQYAPGNGRLAEVSRYGSLVLALGLLL